MHPPAAPGEGGAPPASYPAPPARGPEPGAPPAMDAVPLPRPPSAVRLSPVLQAVLGVAAGVLVFTAGTALLLSHPRLPVLTLTRPAVAGPSYRQVLARDHQRYAQAGDAAAKACATDIAARACSTALEGWAEVADGYLQDLRRERAPACYRQADTALRAALPLVSAGSRHLVGSAQAGDPVAMDAALTDLRTGDQQYSRAIQMAAQQKC